MVNRSAPDNGPGAAEQEFGEPGILANDTSCEGDSDLSDCADDGAGDFDGSDSAEGDNDSDMDAGVDADAESLGSDEQDEEAVDGNSPADAAGGGDATAATDDDRDVDLDNPSSSSGGSDSDSELEPGSSASERDDDNEPNAVNGSAQQQQAASFLEGGKAASFAKAFAKIMAKPSKAAATSAKDVILCESAGLAKRKAEVEADDAAAHQRKKQRQEMRKRGHFKVPKKGEDPAHDVVEKQLLKLATRGVVLLFNAVNKAQKQKREAEAAGLKGSKVKAAAVSKAGFLAELKTKSANTLAAGERLVPAAAAAAASLQQQRGQQQQQHGGAGWEVLGEGFPGLTGGVKMKDWDKTAGSDGEANGRELAGSDDDSDSGGEGW